MRRSLALLLAGCTDPQVGTPTTLADFHADVTITSRTDDTSTLTKPTITPLGIVSVPADCPKFDDAPTVRIDSVMAGVVRGGGHLGTDWEDPSRCEELALWLPRVDVTAAQTLVTIQDGHTTWKISSTNL